MFFFASFFYLYTETFFRTVFVNRRETHYSYRLSFFFSFSQNRVLISRFASFERGEGRALKKKTLPAV